MDIKSFSILENGKGSLRKGYAAAFLRLSEKRSETGDRLLDLFLKGRITESELGIRLKEADDEFFETVSETFMKFKNHYNTPL